MPWELSNDRPIYLQLMERIQMDIVSGKYHAGDKLPSVRDLATYLRIFRKNETTRFSRRRSFTTYGRENKGGEK